MKRMFPTALAAGTCLLFLGAQARAGDVVRLDGKGEDALVLETRGGHGGHGGFHGGYHGHHGGYHGYHGGHRGYYGGGYYGGRYYGGYRGWYGGGYYGGFYRPYYYGSYYPYYYSWPRVYVYSSYYPSYYPIAAAPAPTLTLGGAAPVPGPSPVAPASPYGTPQAPVDGTYPYDGGAPRVPLPTEASPASAPQRAIIPLEGRLVSQPKAKVSGDYVFRAFGETAPNPALSDARFVSGSAASGDTNPLALPSGFAGGSTMLTPIR